MTPLRRNLLISALLAVLVGVTQLVSGNGVPLALLSGAIAFLISLFILRISDRYSRR